VHMKKSTIKLVRDYVPQLIEADGLTPIVRIAGPSEFRQLLIAKLHEEVGEVEQAIDASPADPDKAAVIAELADVLEVLLTILSDLGFTTDDLEAARVRKAAEAGGFSQRLVWSGNALSHDHP
jgi:predicted house-cleaning noncanonical NTP pyrophosphatase (MazG superfamily)